jgi:ABC-2 type transport system ATP-binding protein
MTTTFAPTIDGTPRTAAANVLEARDVRKYYGDFPAVQDVSFEVRRGEIFALLGPNGAGKTTLIRMALDILKPDAGELLVFGEKPSAERKSRIGYLPEERGLYRKQKVRPVLEYLGQLKGLSTANARQEVKGLLERMGLTQWADKKIGELSKGMQQKLQFCGAIIGHPELLVMDEPFSGLDPVNTRLMEDVLEEERRAGASIILCTHQIAKVEQFCDRALVLHRGHVVLYGVVDELIRQYSPESFLVRTSAHLDSLPGVVSTEVVEEAGTADGRVPLRRVVLRPGAPPQELLGALAKLDEPVDSFARERLPLEEIFIRVVEASGESVRQLLDESRRVEMAREAGVPS